MKMRRLFTTAALAMMLVTMTAGTATAAPSVGSIAPGISVTDGTVPSKVITKDYDVTGFTGLEVSGIVEVVLKKSDTYKVSVSIPESLEKYLIVRVREGELKIALTNLNERMAFKTKDVEVIATIEMPMLRSLEMSGATKLSCSDTFDVGDHTFKMELSGASKVNRLDLVGRDLDLEMGGATYLNLSGKFHEVEIEAGGASKCEMDIDALKVAQELSGAAKVKLVGEYGDVVVDATGAAALNAKGNAENMRVTGSGAAKVEVIECVVDNARVELSGAAYCELNALNLLEVELSSGASLRYKDNPDVKLDVRSIGRAASIKKVK